MIFPIISSTGFILAVLTATLFTIGYFTDKKEFEILGIVTFAIYFLTVYPVDFYVTNDTYVAIAYMDGLDYNDGIYTYEFLLMSNFKYVDYVYVNTTKPLDIKIGQPVLVLINETYMENRSILYRLLKPFLKPFSNYDELVSKKYVIEVLGIYRIPDIVDRLEYYDY